MTIYQDLLKKEQFRPFFPRLSLNVAECYARIGKIEQALNTYDEITHSAQNTEEAALALYEMGELYQVHFNNLQKAKELFEQTQKIGGRFEVVRRAQKRINDIALLDHYRSVLPVHGDSVAAAQFHMGELYWFTFEQADSALAAYRAVVERFPESDWAPKALYAVGWLHERLADTTGAAATYQELIDRYSDTEYADAARVRLGMDTKTDEAQRLFLKAETIRLSGAKPDSYLPLFEEVMKSEPKSSYAAKALYVIGWTYESLLGDSTKAIERYKRLLEDFPTSDLSIAAQRRIDLQRHAPPLQTLPATPDSVVVSLDRRKTGDMNDNGTPPDSTAPPDQMYE
jgi:TolA-binding protein